MQLSLQVGKGQNDEVRTCNAAMVVQWQDSTVIFIRFLWGRPLCYLHCLGCAWTSQFASILTCFSGKDKRTTCKLGPFLFVIAYSNTNPFLFVIDKISISSGP